MFNIGAQSKVKESKHAQLGPVCHVFARKVLPQLNEEKTLFWRSRDHLRAILGVLISVWNLVKPSMFTTQCTSSFSSSCICAAQPRPPVVHMQWHPPVAPGRLLLGLILGYSLLGFYPGASCGVTFHVTNPLPASSKSLLPGSYLAV